MRQLTYTPEFKKEWSWIESEGVEQIVTRWLKCRGIKKTSSDYFGMCYTSTSSYAMAGNTNNPVKTDLYNEDGTYIEASLSHFALTDHDSPMLIIVYEDQENNFYYYELESDDYLE